MQVQRLFPSSRRALASTLSMLVLSALAVPGLAHAGAVPSELICIGSSEINVRDSSLATVQFQVGQGEGVAPTGNTKAGTVDGTSYTFIEVSFPRLNETGWVDQDFVSSLASCSYYQINLPTTLPAGFDPTVETCAEQLLLAGAKTNVASQFGDRPESAGDCAFGVRTSLQQSGVGGVTGGLGNAIDFISALPPLGFVDSGLRDPNIAPPGAIIVFDGPNSAGYLHDGDYGSPAGDWLGHVTIKGDDGYYYTDAKTDEPAIGWESGMNVDGERDVAGIYVPGPELVNQYAGKCGN